MRRLALLLCFIAPPAHADAEGWKGTYGGFGIGGATAHSTWTTDATLGTLDEPVEHSARGAFGSAQIGYRFPAATHLLLGLEFAWYPGRMEDRSEANLPGGPANRERVTKISHPLSAAVQVGIAGSKTLVYARGGFAYAMIELQAINHQVGNVATWDDHASGWTAGAGFEYQIRKHLSLGFEYDTMRLRAVNLSAVNSGGVTVEAADFRTRVNLYLLRANYRY